MGFIIIIASLGMSKHLSYKNSFSNDTEKTVPTHYNSKVSHTIRVRPIIVSRETNSYFVYIIYVLLSGDIFIYFIRIVHFYKIYSHTGYISGKLPGFHFS